MYSVYSFVISLGKLQYTLKYKFNEGTRMRKKPAFTMLELIMVIVVLGILAALAIPRTERDLRQEAGDNILSAIRYTQHLALMDNKTNPSDPQWQRTLWQIRFAQIGGEWMYIVAANNDNGANLDRIEAAIEPTSGKYMWTSDAVVDNDESPNIFITNKYGVNSVDFTNCDGITGQAGRAGVAVRHIGFDYMGRPHRGLFGAGNDFATVLHADCQIKFTFTDNNIDDLEILIRQETGYANIVGQNAS